MALANCVTLKPGQNYRDDLATDQEVMIYLDAPQLDREAGLIRFWRRCQKRIQTLWVSGSPNFFYNKNLRELINLEID